MRVSSSLIAYIHENQTCTSNCIIEFSQLDLRFDLKLYEELHESMPAIFYVHSEFHLMAWSNENKSCMRVDKSMRTARVT
jgi:hypothetical protein